MLHVSRSRPIDMGVLTAILFLVALKVPRVDGERTKRTPSRVDSRSDQELWLRGRHLQTAVATPDDASSHHEWRHAQMIACVPTTPWLVSETHSRRGHQVVARPRPGPAVRLDDGARADPRTAPSRLPSRCPRRPGRRSVRARPSADGSSSARRPGQRHRDRPVGLGQHQVDAANPADELDPGQSATRQVHRRVNAARDQPDLPSHSVSQSAATAWKALCVEGALSTASGS